MIKEISILIGFISIIAAAMCAGAGNAYKFQKGLKDDGNPLYKIVGQDQKFIDDKEEWIKRYRRRVIIFYAVIVAVAVVIFLQM